MIITIQREVQTKGEYDHVVLTEDVKKLVQEASIDNGVAFIHCTGSTACIIITEFESGAMQDLKEKFEELAPREGNYRHHLRGVDDNGRAHVLSAFLNRNVTIPVIEHKLALGTWQELVLIDLDTRPRTRTWILQILGE